MNKLIASAVSNSDVSYFSEIFADMIDVDLSNMFVYIIDLVDSSALNLLAIQFNVYDKGYLACKTDEKRREFIKNGIILQKYAGTVFSIKEACRIIGFVPKAIHEGVIINGQRVWCAFNVELSPDSLGDLTSSSISDLISLINKYKPARCILTEVYFSYELDDSMEIQEELEIQRVEDVSGDYSNDYSYDYY